MGVVLPLWRFVCGVLCVVCCVWCEIRCVWRFVFCEWCFVNGVLCGVLCVSVVGVVFVGCCVGFDTLCLEVGVVFVGFVCGV